MVNGTLECLQEYFYRHVKKLNLSYSWLKILKILFFFKKKKKIREGISSL
jgi:hypothetical protein